ncbi:hypothetical protein evm_014352 [Chilo suppressalis]|nr:hypothetical protein evm_014352 [Chilo suppressalis]
MRILINWTIPYAIKKWQVRVSVYTIKENKTSIQFSYQIPDPCKHFMVAFILQGALDLNSCALNKRTYYFDMDLFKIAQAFYGSTFFYGDYMIQSKVITKKGTIFCLRNEISFRKKPQ